MTGGKLSPKKIAALERRRQALELRKAGATFEAIAAQVGYSSHNGAYKAVKAALRETIQQPADELRKLENERLDRLTLAIYQQGVNGDREAIDRLLKIMKRRAELNGLDAPKQHEHDDGAPPVQITIIEVRLPSLLSRDGTPPTQIEALCPISST